MYLLLPIIIIASLSFANLNISLGGSMNSGSLLYDLEAPVATESSLDYHITSLVMSELEYPVHPYSPTVLINYTTKATGSKRELELFLSGRVGVGVSKTPMKDSDWFGARVKEYGGSSSSESTIRFKFSYTESEMRSSAYEFGGGFAVQTAKPFGKQLYLGARFEYGYFDAKMYGINGWVYLLPDSIDDSTATTDDMVKKVIKDRFRDTLVLTYNVKYFIPYITTKLVLANGRSTRISLNLDFSPYAMAEDNDDHVLRYKAVRTVSRGWAFSPGLSADFMLTKTVSLKLFGSFRVVRNSGDMDQYWYENEEYGGEIAVEKGTKIIGIPAHFKSTVGSLSASVVWQVR